MLQRFNFIGTPIPHESVFWIDNSNWPGDQKDGIRIAFNMHGQIPRREAIEIVSEAITRDNLNFIKHLGRNWWQIDFDSAKRFFKNENFSNSEWIHSVITCTADVEVTKGTFDDNESTRLEFYFSKKELQLMTNQKIFLSHKGVDKPLVRSIAQFLRNIGFQPWIDEDAMPAGAHLEREADFFPLKR